jgi:hypothetical protein
VSYDPNKPIQIPSEAPGTPKVAAKPQGTDARARRGGIYGDEFRPPSPQAIRLDAGYQRRDGVDSFLGTVEWVHHMRGTGQLTAATEQLYREKLQSETAFWKEFMTPTDEISAEWIARQLQVLWRYPIARGRMWSAATLSITVRELGIQL